MDGAGETTEQTENILREEEAGRAVAFGRAVSTLGVFALIILVTPQIALTTVERIRTAIPVAIITVIGAVMWWRARDASRYPPTVARIFVVLSAFGALAVIYALGVFTPVVIILTIGLGLDPRDRVLARILPPLVIGSYFLLAILVTTHAIPDIGAWRAPGLEQHLTMAVVIAAVFIVQIIFVRATRRSREEAVARVREMSRVVRTREAQLEEVRENLDFALRRGVTGRHTGRIVGGYRVGDMVGRGAMGEVYAATDPDGARLVAMKILLTPDDEEVVHRFLREAEIALKVRGPNLIDIYGMGRTDEGSLFIVMELLEGRDLSAILRERRSLPLQEVVVLVEEVARGLDELHAAGVIHRDLKPQNLFQPFMGEWKVLDYGVSKLGGTGTMTKGDIIGTPAYMAPEQAQGKPVNRRADVFALGAVAYRALTGRRAFGGSDVPQILYQVVHGKPTRARDIDPTIPYQVETVLMKSLEKDPTDRYATASELATSLRRASEGMLDSTPELEEQTVRTVEATGIRASAAKLPVVDRRKSSRR